MADSNHNRRADFLDDDPFAELTRIMGHDPRAPQGRAEVQPAAEVVAFPDFVDDFGAGLEKEMGELDLTGFERFEAEPRPEAAVVQAAAPEAEWLAAAPLAAKAPEPSRPAPAFEAEDFGSALERELFAGQDEPLFEEEAAPARVEPVVHQEAEPVIDHVAEPVSNDGPVSAFDEDVLDLSFLEEEIARDAAPAPVAEPVRAFELEPEPQWDIEPADIEPAVEAVAFDETLVADAAPSSHDDVAWEAAVEAAPAADAARSLEDELNALLSGETGPVVAPAARQDGWRPSVETFGRANFAAQKPAGTWEMPAAPVAIEASAPEVIDAVEEAPEFVAAAADDFGDIFGDDFTLEVEDEPQAPESKAAPEAWPAAAVTAAGVAAASRWQPRSSEVAAPAASAPAYAPEVETVDVAEAAPAVVDDLDIPDVDYASPEPRSFDEIDDIEAEFAQAFGDLSAAGQPEPAHAPVAAAVAPDAFSVDAYALGEEAWQSAASPADDGFDYESDLEHAVAMSTYEDAAPQKPASGRRGLMIAALLGGVALVGGLGVFGMSFFGGETDGPAMVRADTEPMKVRPENPGGATVPNQDSQAYARVAGGQQDQAPGQERLITTAEEPVDVAAQTQPPALAPGIEDEEMFVGEGAEAEGAPKSEERLDPAATEAETTAAGEVAAVAPRRVRTMIVKPDGTLVPREEIEPAAPVPLQEPAAEMLAAAPLGGALAPADEPAQPDPAQPGEEAALDAEEGGPVVETPPTVRVVPSPRAQAQAPAPAAAPQPPVQRQQPAATPVSAPAAAAPAAGGAGEWSMQIASQPTAEGAQSTYQDLARRYGSVLQGKGVNIVRADIEGMGTYYRVRIPASSRDEAIQLCTRYKAAGGSCFVSR